jgi:topoisomerase-4 subunit A
VKVAEVMGWRTVGTKLLDYNKSVQMEWVKANKAITNQSCFNPKTLKGL